MPKPQWISFEDTGFSQSGKTRTWDITSKTDGHHLGTVQWFATWRQYVFVPRLREEDDLMTYYVYNPACLREIADFIEGRTKDHRVAQRAAIRVPGRGR